MRHAKRTKLGMKSQHARATLANLVCSLIAHNRIRTTIAKAKVARRHADKMVTLAKKGTLHDRRLALAFLRNKDAVQKLFADVGKAHADRQGGYTRIVRVGPRPGDAAEIAILEWTGTVAAPIPATPAKSEADKTESAEGKAKAKTKSKAAAPATEEEKK